MGVDFSSSMLNIQDNHAYDIKNFIKRNGSLQKRNPYKQVGNEKLNGVWECYYKGTKYTIAHKGTNLYLVDNIDNYDMFAQNYKKISGNATIGDQKSWGIFANDRLYILCGNYVVVKFKEKDEEVYLEHFNVYDDSDTYIPTTTIGITENGSQLSINRTTLDNVNLLSPYRYNSIFAIINKDENYKYFLLDGKVNFDFPSSLIVTYFNNGVYYTEKLNGVYSSGGSSNRKEETLTYQIGINGDQILATINKTTFYDDFNEVSKIEGGDILAIKVEGETFKVNAEEYGNDNIQFKFKNESTPNESHLITNCTFGVMYGAGGNRNRLFVSGNPSKPNVDYHTSRRNIYANDADVDLLDSQDLTYFSVYDYCAYGTSNTAITDYQIMGDGSLMVLKEESFNEPNIYFRDSNYEIKTIALGSDSTEVVEETYPMRVGNIGEGAIRGVKSTLRNLNNDLVFLSNNGVFGISSTISAGQLNSDYKYSYGRSRLINSKLTEYLKESLNVATIVYDHKYFVTIKLKDKTYKTFVADGRYAYKLQDSIDNEYEYEWFVLEGINADCYHIIDEKLYYCNEKGLFRFDVTANCNDYQDIDVIDIWDGVLKIEYDHDDDEYNFINRYVNDINFDLAPIYNSSKTILEIVDENASLYLGTFYTNNKGVVVFDEKKNNDKVKDYLFTNVNHKLYAVANGNVINLRVEQIEDESDLYVVYNTSNNQPITTQENVEFMLFASLQNKKLEVCVEYFEDYGYEITELIDTTTQHKCTIYYQNNTHDFNIVGTFTIYNNIECYYLTKAYNFGQSVYAKYLKSMTMINDCEALSYTNFGIITKEIKTRFESNYLFGTNGLVDTYENIFKADLTTGRFATSFTKDFLLKFNFIQFEFYNFDDTNCIFNNFTILYTTGFKTKGVS